MKRELPIVILKAQKERAVKNLHPWIFSGATKKIPADLAIGELVLVKSHEGEALALGHYCKSDGLVIRLCSFNVHDLVDDNFWQARFLRAHEFRKSLGLPNAKTSGYRLIHGEGDRLGGLVCDIYGSQAAIKLSNPGLVPVIPLLCDYLVKNLHLSDIFFEEEEKRPRPLYGSLAQAPFLEHGLKFVAELDVGQKTGYFLDQRENRRLLQHYAQGKRVLDAFCYAGGFSVYALAAGAKSVTSVDLSERALKSCNDHVDSNGPFVGIHRGLHQDCFSYLREIGRGDFDVIVLDPPAFAKSASAVMRASRGYKDINLLALRALSEQGVLFTFSCSQHISMDLFKKIIFAAAKDSGRDVAIIHELSQTPDHPVSVYCPQSSYLKGLVLKVD